MGKTNTFENDTLGLIFTNSTPSVFIGGLTGILGSSTAGNLYIALFTADPTDAGTTTNECNYTGYARKAVVRTSSGWTVSGDTCINAAAITFNLCTAGTETATHFGVCTSSPRLDSTLLFYGEFSGGGLSISVGVTPQIQAGNLSVIED